MTLPSEVIWSSAAPHAWKVLCIAGLALAVLSLISYFTLFRLLRAHGGNKGVATVPGQNYRKNVGTSYMWPKMGWEGAMLRLGPVMIICSVVGMCVPELTLITNLFSTVYRAYGFYSLVKYIVEQFGGIKLLTRDNGKGTLQSHAPFKVWAVPGFCCFWGPLYPWLNAKIFDKRDGRIVYNLVTQFMVLGPVSAGCMIVVAYEGISVDALVHVGRAASAVSLVSLLLVIYGCKVLITVGERCTWIVDTLIDQLNEKQQVCLVPQDGSHKPHRNINSKFLFLELVTVPGSIAALICSFAITDSSTNDNGDVISDAALQAFYSNAVNLLFNIIGAWVAWKAFPVGKEALEASREQAAQRHLEAELYPALVLEGLIVTYTRELVKRQAEGRVLDLGLDRNFVQKHFSEFRDLENGRTIGPVSLPGLRVTLEPIDVLAPSTPNSGAAIADGEAQAQQMTRNGCAASAVEDEIETKAT